MGMIGAILGDIAGSRWEFADMDKIRKSGGYELFTDKNYFTDDTVMSLACKNAILRKKIFSKPDFAKYYRMYGRKYPHAGYGSAFAAWLASDSHGAYGSFGNGSAMRCSFIGEYAGSLVECLKLATMSAKVAHDHPEGIKGAVVLATCVFMAEHDCSKDEILNYAINEYPPITEKADTKIIHGELNGKYEFSPIHPTSEYIDTIKYQISCQGSVPVAIRCFYETGSFEDCMYLINSMEIDTDTVGAIAGAICHSFYKKCTDDDDGLLKKYLPNNLYEITKI